MGVLLYKIKRFVTNKWVFFNLLFVVLVQLFMWSYLFVNYKYYDADTFLHYTVGIGVDLVGKRNQLFMIPLSGFTILIVNSVVAFTLYEKNKISSIFLEFFVSIAHLYLIIATLLIVSLNV